MRHLGTIKKYFPFFDSETQKTLKSIMDDALNYADFVDSLCKYVCSEVSSENLVYLATIFAGHTKDHNSLQLVREKYAHSSLVELHFIEVHKKLEAIDSILLKNPDDWIVFDLQYQRFQLALTHSIGSALEYSALEEMENIVQKDDALKCFELNILILKSWLFYHEGKPDEALECLERAIGIAKENNDRYEQAHILWLIVMVISGYPKLGLQIIGEIEKIANELGYLDRQCDLWNLKGRIHRNLGELNTTIECYLKCIECIGTIGSPTTYGFLFRNLAGAYNGIGDGENALEWAKMSIEAKPFPTLNPIIRANSYLQMAWALTNLGKLDEAEYYLDIGRELALDVGMERVLYMVYEITALWECAKGDFQTAMDTIQTMEGYDSHVGSLCILAECEIALFTHYEDQTQDDTGPWLTRFETLMRESDTPGYLGLALLIKAELRLNQGRVNDAYNILREAIDISQNPGTRFLKKKIAKLILTAFPEQS